MRRGSDESDEPSGSDAARFWLILAGAILVRVWGLGWQSLTMDEAVGLRMAMRPLGLILFDNTDNTPPLYYLALRAWMGIFGSSEQAVRALSAGAGVLTVALTGWAGRILGTAALADAAMVLMALLPMPVIYSQTARSYAFFAAASAASFGCLLAWTSRPRPARAAAYLASTLAMCYAHNYWVFNVAAQQGYLAWSVLRRKASPRAWAALSAGLLAGYLPLSGWLARRAFSLQRGGFWIPAASVGGVLSALRSHFIFHVPRIAALPYLALLALGIAASFPASKRLLRGDPAAGPARSGWLLVALWAACPILLPWLYSLVATPILWPRYTIAASPAFCLLIARGALSLPRSVAAGAALGLLSLLSALSLSVNLRVQQEDWRSAVARLAQAAADTDVIIPYPFYVVDPVRYYYRGKTPVVTLPPTRTEDFLDAALAGHGRAWVLMRQEARSGRRPLPEILLERRKDARLVYAEDFGYGVYLIAISLGPSPEKRPFL